MGNKKVLHLNYEFPPIGGGGGRANEKIASLTSEQWDVEVLTCWFPDCEKIDSQKPYKIHRVKSIRRHKDRCSILEMAAFIICAFPKAISLIRKNKPDLIHCHFAVPTGVLAYLLNKIFKIPYILTLQGGDVPSMGQVGKLFDLIKPLTNPIWANSKMNICVGKLIHDLAKKDYPFAKTTIIPNGVDRDFFFKSVKERPHPYPIHLMYAGRFSPEKNIPYLMEVINKLPNDLDFIFHILGNGPLLNLIPDDPKIRFYGWSQQETIREVMQQAHILTIPSITEGLNLTALEALCCGMTIVAHNNAGHEMFIKNGVNGILCEPGVNNFIDAILEATQKLTSLQEEVKKDNLEQFDWKNIAFEYSKLYQQILEN